MNLSGARVLVTGGAGFIPSHIVDLLVKRGASVCVLDNLQAGYLENLAESRDHIEFHEGDVRDADLVAELVARQDAVFHLAANANVPYSVENPRYDFETNALGAFNVYSACVRSDVERIVYASSAAVYGPPEVTPMDERHRLNPISPYGVSKLTAERLGFAYRETFGMPFTAFRIFNTFGPRQPRYVIHDLFRKLQKDPSVLEVLGTGEQIRDYCYVADTAGAFVRAVEDDRTEGDVYNIAGGRSTSIRELVELILATLELRDTKVYYTGKSWPGDIGVLMADISKIEAIGFQPTVSLEQGLERFAEWISGCPEQR